MTRNKESWFKKNVIENSHSDKFKAVWSEWEIAFRNKLAEIIDDLKPIEDDEPQINKDIRLAHLQLDNLLADKLTAKEYDYAQFLLRALRELYTDLGKE